SRHKRGRFAFLLLAFAAGLTVCRYPVSMGVYRHPSTPHETTPQRSCPTASCSSRVDSITRISRAPNSTIQPPAPDRRGAALIPGDITTPLLCCLTARCSPQVHVDFVTNC